jgi:hypothetical protein
MTKIKIQGRESLGEISYSGADIQAYAYIPLINDPTVREDVVLGRSKRSVLFGTLQTISITSTRSVTPVRVLGRASPLGYSRGGRTSAGTLVFATLDRDAFSEIYRPDALHESWADSSTSMFVDQLPPFNIVLVASNELGGIARQVLSGVTLINYGVTYSIDDIYTETTYTYVAEDITPLLPDTQSLGPDPSPTYKTMSEALEELYHRANGSAEQIYGPKDNEYSYAETAVDSLLAAKGLRQTAFWGKTVLNQYLKRVLPPNRYWFTRMKRH